MQQGAPQRSDSTPRRRPESMLLSLKRAAALVTVAGAIAAAAPAGANAATPALPANPFPAPAQFCFTAIPGIPDLGPLGPLGPLGSHGPLGNDNNLPSCP